MVVAGALLAAIALSVGLVARPVPVLPTATASALPSSGGAVAQISVEDARAALDTGQAVFVDVRSTVGYEDGHIRGALSIPLPDLEARWTELDPADWILLYCA
jgi:3-mercaptopyruvate sulfurtransferase SseA